MRVPPAPWTRDPHRFRRVDDEYANSVIESNGHSSDSAAMEAAGRLKGITAEGAFISASDTESDVTKARQAA